MNENLFVNTKRIVKKVEQEEKDRRMKEEENDIYLTIYDKIGWKRLLQLTFIIVLWTVKF